MIQYKIFNKTVSTFTFGRKISQARSISDNYNYNYNYIVLVLVWKSRCHWAGQTWGDNPSWKTCGRRYQLKSWKESQTLGQSYISSSYCPPFQKEREIKSVFNQTLNWSMWQWLVQSFSHLKPTMFWRNSPIYISVILNSGVNKPLTAVESRHNILFFFHFVSSFWYLYMSCFGLFCSVLLIPPYCCVESVQTVHILHHSSIIPHHLLL